MAENIKKEIIHANGFDIRIFTTDFENEYLSLTDIAKYKSNLSVISCTFCFSVI